MPGRAGPVIKNNKDGSISINYDPKDRGIHEMNVIYNEQNLEGGPFRCMVDTVGSNFVTAYGPGLNMAASGKETCFTVVGDVAVSVDGPQKTDVKKQDGKDGAHQYCYTPMSAGEYNIDIKAKGKPIHGSPFSAKVSGEGRKRSQCALPASSEIGLGSANTDLANLVGTLKLPSGSSEPCLLKKMPDSKLGIASFTPKSKGTYQVEVVSGGKGIAGSPFKINVGDAQVACAAKVKITGNGLQHAEANKQNEFNIDITNAGYGSISISVEGMNRADIDAKENGAAGQYVVSYKPHEPGIYLVNVRFADDHMTGSPFMVNVGGQPSGRVRETVTKEITAIGYAGPQNKCEFQLKIPGTDPLDMEALLTAPNGKTELCSIRDLPHSLYEIDFTPEVEGVHTVSLKHKGLHLSGSPFQYTVGQVPAGGPHKVEIGGTGLEKGEVGIVNDFNIYTREAGGGTLSVAIEGPAKAVMDVQDRGHGYTTVSYKVDKDGEYGAHIKYNGQHVPDSPTFVYIAPECGDAKLVTVHGIRDRGLAVDKPVTFNVNLNGARSPNKSKGILKSFVDTPSGKEEDVFLQELDSDMHAVRFLPHENGIHYVSIKFNEAHIPGSPFPILIGKMSFDPALVLANGDGLLKGECGKPSKFNVVTTNAGEGTLAVSIDGPSKVAITCQDVENGYQFTYVPMAAGDYMITIKYSNVTIAGCPSMATVTGEDGGGKGKKSDIRENSILVVETVEKKPGAENKKKFVGDASKVIAKGNGLQKAFQNRAANFTMDVKGAGKSLLTVGIVTPMGNPVEELTYKKQRGTTMQVNYRSSEKGEHQLTIRWGQDEIPGSPFTIKVA